MSNWKRYIPPFIKLFIKQAARKRRDLFNGTSKQFAVSIAPQNNFYKAVEITQAIKTNPASQNKIHNLTLAIKQVNNLIIYPGQVFSFWKLVGNPSEKNGYQKSRSIVNGELEAAVGGGLCQLSGLIYFMAIKAGFEITERHAHSIDIYKDEERFTPLGSDATVAFGYKDLRFKNPFPFPVQLQFALTGNSLSGSIYSKKELAICEIEFQYNRNCHFTDVITIKKEKEQAIQLACSRYRLLQQ